MAEFSLRSQLRVCLNWLKDKIAANWAQTVVSVTINGRTITVTKGDNSSTDLTTQDTTYSAATQSANGLMSSSDKTKLDGIATGAEVNQNAFSNITIGSTTIQADGKTDTLTFVAGSNVTLTPDATNDKITIAATDTTYSAATTSAAGLMSADDKTKLDGIATGANAYTHPSYTARTGKPTANATPGFGGTVTISQITSDATGHVTAANDKTITIPDTVMGAASANAAGTKGLVPAPAAGAQGSVLLGNGTWSANIAGKAGKADQLNTARAIDGVNFNGTAAIIHYGECSTAAATAAKTVACTGFTLVTGARIAVKFTVTNTADNPTLNVQSTGAKAIQYRGSAINKAILAANRTYEFIYDGTNWQLVGDTDSNTTYSVATSSANGLMSKEDKVKLDAISAFLSGGTEGQVVVATASGYGWSDLADVVVEPSEE